MRGGGGWKRGGGLGLVIGGMWQNNIAGTEEDVSTTFEDMVWMVQRWIWEQHRWWTNSSSNRIFVENALSTSNVH